MITELKELEGAKETILLLPWLVHACSRELGVWEYSKVHITTLDVREITYPQFLKLKEKAVHKRLSSKMMSVQNKIQCLIGIIQTWVATHEENVTRLKKSIADMMDLVQREEESRIAILEFGESSGSATLDKDLAYDSANKAQKDIVALDEKPQQILVRLEAELRCEQEKLSLCELRLKHVKEEMFLPTYIWRKIIGHGIEHSGFGHLDLISLAKTCKQMNSLSKEEKFWNRLALLKHGDEEHGSKASYKTRFHQDRVLFIVEEIKQCDNTNDYIQAEIKHFKSIVEEYGENHAIVKTVMSRLDKQKALNETKKMKLLDLLDKERHKLSKANLEWNEEKVAASN